MINFKGKLNLNKLQTCLHQNLMGSTNLAGRFQMNSKWAVPNSRAMASSLMTGLYPGGPLGPAGPLKPVGPGGPLAALTGIRIFLTAPPPILLVTELLLWAVHSTWR